MKKITRQILTSAFAALVGLGTLQAYDLKPGEALFSYSVSPEKNVSVFGVGDGDNHFDVAIRIDAKQLEGMKVKGVLVPFGDTSFLEKMSAWVSSGLNHDRGDMEHVPDIMTQNFTYNNPSTSELGLAEVMFDTPYEIGKDDVYVGYTFWVAELNEGNYNPIFISNKNGEQGKGLFVQTGGWGWKDVAKLGNDWCSVLQLVLEAPEAGVMVPNVSDVRIPFGETAEINVPIYRAGAEKVTSLDYELTIDNQVYPYHIDITDAKDEFKTDHITYKPYVLKVTTPRLREKGNHKFYIEVTKVNGKPNANKNKRCDANVVVADYIPKKIPVVEEATSTGCGYCTRGWYSLEVMGRLHRESDDVICVSYHNEDQKRGEPMTVMAKCPFPSLGNPTLKVDRVVDPSELDPNMKTPTFGVQEAWEKRIGLIPPAGVEVSCEWLDADKNELEVTAKVMFIENVDDGRYTLDIGLLHDRMTGNGSAWAQSNYYSGVKGGGSEPEWEIIANGKSPMSGLWFNDVFVAGASEDFKGIPGSLPQVIKEDDIITVKHVFKMNELKNTSGDPIIQKKTYLRPFAVLINKSNEIENAGVCKVDGYDSIDEVEVNGDKVPVAYYDLTGRRISNPENGIYIVKMSDGSTVKKVIR